MPAPSSGPSDDPILTTREAARLLGIAVSTAQQWIEHGLLPAWKTPGGHRRLRLSAVSALLRERAGLAPLAPALPAPPAAPADDAHTLPDNETERLAALDATGLVGSGAEAVFDRLTWLASQVTDSPIAMLTLVDEHRQWFKSRVGIGFAETPREMAFCSHTILSGEPMIVADTHLDGRFRDNPMVTGAPHIRFYAGVPLVDAKGFRLGALCVMDREPRRLRERELRALGELADIAAEEIRRRCSAVS
ncbi:GAF domain-containing protein [Massilia sp.]|uniref:GAF domain-containing protein n=1 Tax=Massilia sp. TaxID=1882437 RepID=UPI0028B1D025|nr:GAF domain-containing protein [Massilia sp.]